MDWSQMQLRVGAVSYLNSKPLIEGLPNVLPDADLSLDVPSRLADALGTDELDVALIPSIEAFQRPDYEVISDACVATHGPVLSVRLFCRVHPGEIRTLALDEGSRTSVALTRIMLAERYGVTPRTELLPLDCSISDTTADAILLIGDRAIHEPPEAFHTVWDLGQEWLDWTGLPFVFAMWVTRVGTKLPGVDAALRQARDRGLESIPEIAEEWGPKIGISPETATSYLTRNLFFRMRSAERSGLRLFHELAAKNGLVPAESQLRFRQATPARSQREEPASVCGTA